MCTHNCQGLDSCQGNPDHRVESEIREVRFGSGGAVRCALLVNVVVATWRVGAGMQGPRIPNTPRFLQSTIIYDDVLALIGDSVICTDEDGRVLLFNHAAEQSFGYDRAEVIGQPVEMLLPQRYCGERTDQVRSFASGEGATNRLMGRQREVWSRRKNGEEFPAEATISRHSVKDRTILTVVHRDITERKQLEKQNETIAQELDHRIQNVFRLSALL